MVGAVNVATSYRDFTAVEWHMHKDLSDGVQSEYKYIPLVSSSLMMSGSLIL
jgi:hypothetical protein